MEQLQMADEENTLAQLENPIVNNSNFSKLRLSGPRTASGQFFATNLY